MASGNTKNQQPIAENTLGQEFLDKLEGTKSSLEYTKELISGSAKERSILNPKTIKYITNNNPIEITPPEIIFRDIEINQTYEIVVYVRNLTKKVRRIRIY